MRPETALYQLGRYPAVFLRNYAILISGSAVSGLRNVQFGHHTTQPRGAGAPNEAFKFGQPVVQSTTSTPETVAVHNVRMIPNTESIDLADLEAYTLGGGGPDIMVTGQLSDCSFAVLSAGGNHLVAHVQSGGVRVRPAELKAILQQTGRFHGHAGQRLTRVFGRGDYTFFASVLGVRVVDQWQIYAQHFTGAGLSFRITDVTRLV